MPETTLRIEKDGVLAAIRVLAENRAAQKGEVELFGITPKQLERSPIEC
jgi:hypothetical protein